VAPEVEAIAEHLSANQRQAVQLAVTVAAASHMPADYTRDDQERDAVLAVWPMQDAVDDPLRLTARAIRELLKARFRRVGKINRRERTRP
jgi:tellurite resistance protein